MRFDVITVMPDMFNALRDHGVVGRAMAKGTIRMECWNPRQYTHDVHQTVDDRPYGGGPGMVMKAQPLLDTINDIKRVSDAPVIYVSPQGKQFDQAAAQRLAALPSITLLAGRYEGVDERLIEQAVDEEYSIGDYVLSGGELPAMVMIDAIARLLPNVLGHEDSAQQDSFMDGLLDCPHYTRPDVFEERAVPSVLLSGNHKAIAQWRRKQALGRTYARRPDLFANWLKKNELSDQDHLLLDEYRSEQHPQREHADSLKKTPNKGKSDE